MPETKKYRKKPVVIEAMQFDGKNHLPVMEWAGVMLENDDTPLMWGSGDALFIVTLEGTMEAAPNDYIIKGVKGEFYPCKPDIFAATYEEVAPDA